MNNRLKKGIKSAFEIPEPDYSKKESFLRTLPQPKISVFSFIFTQATYMRKWVLILSILMLLPAMIGTCFVNINTLWIVSSVVPFLALLAVTESKRSLTYGMSELEMSTRFSLKSVVLARMSVLGFINTMFFCCAIPLCYLKSNTSLIQTGVYLFVPYLLTVNISLWITRRFSSKESLFACMSVAALVSTANATLRFMISIVYQFYFIKWGLVAAVLLVGIMLYEAYRTIKQTEELAWSL